MYSTIVRHLDFWIDRLFRAHDFKTRAMLLSFVFFIVLGVASSTTTAIGLAGAWLGALPFLRAKQDGAIWPRSSWKMDQTLHGSKIVWRRCDFALAPWVLGDGWIKKMDMAEEEKPESQKDEKEDAHDVKSVPRQDEAVQWPDLALPALLFVGTGHYIGIAFLAPFLIAVFLKRWQGMLSVITCGLAMPFFQMPSVAIVLAGLLTPGLQFAFKGGIGVSVLAFGWVIADATTEITPFFWPCFMASTAIFFLKDLRRPWHMIAPFAMTVLLILFMPRYDLSLFRQSAASSGVNDVMDPFSVNRLASSNEVLATIRYPQEPWRIVVYELHTVKYRGSEPIWKGSLVMDGQAPIYRSASFPKGKPKVLLAQTRIDEPKWDESSLLALPHGYDMQLIDRLIQSLHGKTADDKAMDLLHRMKRWRYATIGTTVEEFLKQKRGYCAMYASVYALALRRMGLPAMVETGFLPDKSFKEEEAWDLRGDLAHAWVLAKVNGHWQRLDPTPPRPFIPAWANALSAFLSKPYGWHVLNTMGPVILWIGMGCMIVLCMICPVRMIGLTLGMVTMTGFGQPSSEYRLRKNMARMMGHKKGDCLVNWYFEKRYGVPRTKKTGGRATGK